MLESVLHKWSTTAGSKALRKRLVFLLNLAVSFAKWFGFRENLKTIIVYAVF